MISREKRLGFVLLIALDCLIVGAVGELWTRVAIPVKNICWTFDARLGPIFCPNQQTIGHVQRGYRNTFVSNSLGFHDVERQLEHPSSSYRIQVFGDSLIVAGGVRIEETIPAVVERLLDTSDTQSVEVLNMALLDSTSSAFLTYKHLGASFRPDMVVLNFMDDFPDNLLEVHRQPHHPHHRLDGEGRLVSVPPVAKDLETPWERFKRFSRLYRSLANKLLESRLYARARGAERELRFRLSSRSKEDRATDAEAERRRLLVERGWPLTLEILAAFQEQVERDGARFVLSDGGRLHVRNVGTVYSNRDIEAFCRERGIAYIPTYKAVDRLEAEPERSRFFLTDHHPTPLGNEVLGRFLAEKLAEMIEPGVAEGTSG